MFETVIEWLMWPVNGAVSLVRTILFDRTDMGAISARVCARRLITISLLVTIVVVLIYLYCISGITWKQVYSHAMHGMGVLSSWKWAVWPCSKRLYGHCGHRILLNCICVRIDAVAELKNPKSYVRSFWYADVENTIFRQVYACLMTLITGKEVVWHSVGSKGTQ